MRTGQIVLRGIAVMVVMLLPLTAPWAGDAETDDGDPSPGREFESGWTRIRGTVANSLVESIPDPALLGAITARNKPAFQLDGGHLLWVSYDVQLNGDFLKTGTDDPEQ